MVLLLFTVNSAAMDAPVLSHRSIHSCSVVPYFINFEAILIQRFMVHDTSDGPGRWQ